jgi:hypothetical protein
LWEINDYYDSQKCLVYDLLNRGELVLKKISGIILLAYLAIILGGCSSSSNIAQEQPAQANTQANVNSANTTPRSSGGTQGNEVNQNGIKNYGADNGDGLPATIQLLTEEDLQIAVNQLFKLGYLSGTKITESDLNAALIKFQTAQKLGNSGLLDKETMNSLTSLAEPVGSR